jgi:hypothetical protein
MKAGAQVLASRGQVIGMRPLLAPEDEVVLKEVNGDELLDSSDNRAFRGVKERIAAEVPAQVPQPGDDVTITCLGTGSAMPGKYRNGTVFVKDARLVDSIRFVSQWSPCPNPRFRKYCTGLWRRHMGSTSTEFWP